MLRKVPFLSTKAIPFLFQPQRKSLAAGYFTWRLVPGRKPLVPWGMRLWHIESDELSSRVDACTIWLMCLVCRMVDRYTNRCLDNSF
jgi:hypothetical protein